MVLVNILFEGDEKDCDVISVPQALANDIVELAQMFVDWIYNDESRECWYHDEKYGFVCACETDGFVAWLNKRFKLSGENAVRIVRQHTDIDPALPIIEF